MESLGAQLKKIRLEKGLSLEEVQKKTKIHSNILKAIEGDGLTDLNPVYLKGFLKIYCKFLGLNLKDYLTDYKETQYPSADVIAARDTGAKSENLPSFIKAFSLKLGSLRPTQEFKRVSIFILIVIFLLIGLFNLGKFISSKRGFHLTQNKLVSSIPDKMVNKKPLGSGQVKAVAVTPALQLVEDKSKKESTAEIRLSIRARENCWVSLKADGRLVFQRVLEKGRFESWQAKDKIELSLGNAGAVELEVNGQLFSNLGRKGQTRKNILITKEGLNVGK